ncbi:hypothetical protein BHE97_06030 [Aeromicrobium sp. PE09-221]|uniref:TraR/DksA family transcriptional regulator n=1 Tax=Aeromicrobium sp. PE09-221 TaxID=1898043 RepID=UPI000B3EB26C|nr:TraR/DksA family transcriptional regulator [Aeromicrobium sp. PE09-221]OUZ10987.1 hypothetical protein BHE97_06030 [Aeromicrobium sp. PE09-221]
MTPAHENDRAFSPDDLAELERLLSADRERTVRRMAALGRDVTSIVETTQLGANDDEHDPEGSTIAFERSQASALLASASAHLAEIDAALSRLGKGDYGRCEDCGEPIAHERLRAQPAARRCIGCATRAAR